MRKMVYSCRVRCYDGEIKTFENEGFFRDTDVLRQCLSWWDGAPGPNGDCYHYFETADQQLQNYHSPELPDDFKYPIFSVLRFSPYAHLNKFVNSDSPKTYSEVYY